MSNSNKSTSVTWESIELKQALEQYAKNNMMQGGIPELIRHSVKAYIRQRKPGKNSDCYKTLKGYLE